MFLDVFLSYNVLAYYSSLKLSQYLTTLPKKIFCHRWRSFFKPDNSACLRGVTKQAVLQFSSLIC